MPKVIRGLKIDSKEVEMGRRTTGRDGNVNLSKKERGSLENQYGKNLK